jgi:hypothetical protein
MLRTLTPAHPPARFLSPRLPEQPIFDPALNFVYVEIAREWNSNDERHGNRGFVTEAEVRADAVALYDERQVGAQIHKELWVPAADTATSTQGCRSTPTGAARVPGPEPEATPPARSEPSVCKRRWFRADLRGLHEHPDSNKR